MYSLIRSAGSTASRILSDSESVRYSFFCGSGFAATDETMEKISVASKGTLLKTLKVRDRIVTPKISVYPAAARAQPRAGEEKVGESAADPFGQVPGVCHERAFVRRRINPRSRCPD